MSQWVAQKAFRWNILLIFDEQAVLFTFRILSPPFFMKPVGHKRSSTYVWYKSPNVTPKPTTTLLLRCPFTCITPDIFEDRGCLNFLCRQGPKVNYFWKSITTNYTRLIISTCRKKTSRTRKLKTRGKNSITQDKNSRFRQNQYKARKNVP